MALIDAEREEVVIRILYDGPPLAGKTSTLSQLACVLAERRRGSLFTAGEAEGRTLAFDWMDYLGGWVEGQQVRCQLVTVPGQRTLYARRRLLLQDADVVVFVAEATPAGMTAAREGFAQLTEILAEVASNGVPIPIIVQANKQDLPGALSVDEVRSQMQGPAHVAIVGSSAATGRGVREAFTFAVRIALDRVRELRGKGALATGAPEIRSGQDLLLWLEEQESREVAPRPSLPALPAPEAETMTSGEAPDAELDEPVVSFVPEPAAEIRPAASAPSVVAKAATGAAVSPTLPHSKTPTGLVWPPIGGRILLLDFEGSFRAPVTRRADGGWEGVQPGRWMVSCCPEDVFTDLDLGRRELLQVARAHINLGDILSEHRALTLVKSRDQSWVLWHVADLRHSLAADVHGLHRLKTPAEAARVIWRVALTLVSATEAFPSVSVSLPISLASVECVDATARYAGVVPHGARQTESTEPSAGAGCEILDRELSEPLRELARSTRLDVPKLVTELKRLSVRGKEQAALLDRLVRLLIGHE